MPHFRRIFYDPSLSDKRNLFVHGSVANGDLTSSAQRPLAERFELVVPNRRGFPPNPDVDHVDFENEAVWLDPLVEPGTHLVGHSYGGVIALFAAARYAGRLRSLTVIEPPAFGIVEGNVDVDAFVAESEALWEHGPRDPAAFLRAFLVAVGGRPSPGRPSAALLQGARTLMVERSPSEAVISFDELAGAPFPKLVVSGGHSSAFEAVCDVLEERLGAERAVLPGAGHSVQRLGEPFNELLTSFVERAERL